MGIKLSTSDQVLLLRNTVHYFKERLDYLLTVDFDDDLISYVVELAAIDDIMQDSCILSLKTEAEIDQEVLELQEEAGYRAEARTIYNENRI